MTPEGRIKAACLEYLQLRGIFAWNNPSGAVRIGPGRFMRFGKVGSSDILGVLPNGKILCVECKAKRGKLSPEQAAFLEKIRGLGGLALVVRGWQELDTTLRQKGYVNDGPLFRESNTLP